MAIKPMKKVQVITLQSSKKTVVDYLQKQNAFELTVCEQDKGELCADLYQAQKQLAELDFVVKYLSPYYTDPRGFKYAFFGQKEVFSEKRVEEIVKQFNYQDIIKEVGTIEARINVIHSRKQIIDKELSTIRVFERFGLRLSDVFNQQSVSVLFSRVVKTHFGLLQESLQALTSELEVVVLNETETEVVFYVVVYKSWISQVQAILKKYEAVEAVFSQGVEYVPHYIQSLDEEAMTLEKEEKDLYVRSKELAQELPKLKACYDYFVWKKDGEEALTQSLRTSYTVVLTGWIEAEKFETVRLELVQISQGNAVVVELELEEGELPPVDIENSSFFKPFEIITRMYGMPKAHELDPTPYLAFFFLIFFGLCLTDAFYGFLLAAICFGALVFMKVPRDMVGMLKLVGWGGVATVFAGTLFGGYAGIPVNILPGFLQNIQLIDTNNSDDIMKAIVLVFVLGFIQLWFATFVSGIHTWKSGNKMEALSKNFSWTVFFILIGLSQFVVQDAALSKYMIYGAFILLSLGMAYDTKNIFLKLIVGPLMVINELIGFGSNILSYARLFALGLATGVIAMVFNQIALILGGMMPKVIGIPVMILIILMGHVLNIGINLLGAFIHSARLQFVEFFGKLIEGGGKVFKPLSRKSTYVYIDNNS